jgi:hypothetical protein
MTTVNSTLEEMRKRNPPKNIEAFIAADQPITETDMQTIQAERMKNYTNRDKMPEAYLVYCDAYVQLCGKDQDGEWNQVPTKRVLMDWMQTFEEWKQEHLKPEHIQAAFIKANSDQGFPVGRPGALTTTAIALKTKMNVNVKPQVNTEAIEYTKQIIEEKFGSDMKFVPRPANLPRPTFKGPEERKI